MGNSRLIVSLALIVAVVILGVTAMVQFRPDDGDGDRTYTDEDCYAAGMVPVSLWDVEGDVACDESDFPPGE